MPGGVGDDGVVTCDMPREKMARRLAQERDAALSEKRSSAMTLKNRACATSEESLSSARPFVHSVALSSDWVQVANERHTAPSTLR